MILRRIVVKKMNSKNTLLIMQLLITLKKFWIILRNGGNLCSRKSKELKISLLPIFILDTGFILILRFRFEGEFSFSFKFHTILFY